MRSIEALALIKSGPSRYYMKAWYPYEDDAGKLEWTQDPLAMWIRDLDVWFGAVYG